MREFCTSGSVRGALSNERPYREQRMFFRHLAPYSLAALNWAG